MDTPERCKAGGTPISKFEDSPVFNFINSLSPIKPVKSVQSIQAFHSPCFAAISPVFASPHVSSCKESRFSVRQTFPVSVNQNTTSKDINESILPVEVQSGATPTTITLAQENSNISCSLNEATIDPADESSTQPNLSPPKQFGNCTPNHSTSPCYGDSLDFKIDNGCGSLELVQFVGDGLDNADNSLSTDGKMTFVENLTKGGVSGSVWENFVSVDADDMLLVDTAIGSGASKIQEDDGISVGDETKMECTHKVLSSSFQEEVILNDQDQRTENGVNGSPLGCKAEFQQNRGVRRRCLIFEVAAISKVNQKISSEFPSSYMPAKSTSDDQQKVSSKTLKVQVPCILPGIGLHLNALATSSLDKVISEKTKVLGIELSDRPSSISKFYSEKLGEKHSEIPLALQRHQVLNESKIQNCRFDASQTHAPLNTETSSPKKKKRKTEIGGENEGCKRCHCKKSKCLKLYCECFAAGVYCVEPCSCQGCLNKPSHEDTVLATRKQIESRNPLAFAPKVIVAFEHDNEMGEESNKTPASARHKRGCNCKKSNCLKKYCECFQGGVGCSFSCRCEGCKNAFGMKFGSEENEEEKELDICHTESAKSDDVTESIDVQKKKISHISSNTVAITPFHACSAKPPRPCALLQSCRSRNPQAICEKDINNVEACQDDAIPVIASHSSPSPCTAVKTASPKGKRVSLPLNGIGMSPNPNRKASRRLILKSIPSFPPLCSDTTTS